MHDNVTNIVERGERLVNLEENANALQQNVILNPLFLSFKYNTIIVGKLQPRWRRTTKCHEA